MIGTAGIGTAVVGALAQGGGQAMDWTDPAAIGYPVLAGGVLLGSVVPVVPTGAVVGAAAAIATTTGRMSLVLVVLVAAVAALLGDLLTFAIAKAGSTAALSWVARGQPPERLASVRERFATRGWQLVVIGRLLPAGRIPVLLAAGTLGYPWRRLVPAAAAACVLWALAYALLGIVSGGLFDSPVLATLVAAVLVLVVTVVGSLVSRHRHGGSTARPTRRPAPGQQTGPTRQSARRPDRRRAP